MTAFPTIPYRRERLSHEESIAAARAFLDTVLLRRTVREFSGDPIPAEVLELAIAAAASAPSGANMQPWQFVIVTDPEIKRQIRAAAEKEEYDSYNGRMPDEWLRALAPLQTDWRKEFLEIAPVLIVVFREDYGIDAEGRH
ncbi:MAG TPA: nitroreductase family protein, partial [Thermoanaerobaculia bacterium]